MASKIILSACLFYQVALAVVQVMQPVALKNKIAEINKTYKTPPAGAGKSDEDFGGIVHAAMANFGHIRYGQSIVSKKQFTATINNSLPNLLCRWRKCSRQSPTKMPVSLSKGSTLVVKAR